MQTKINIQYIYNKPINLGLKKAILTIIWNAKQNKCHSKIYKRALHKNNQKNINKWGKFHIKIENNDTNSSNDKRSYFEKIKGEMKCNWQGFLKPNLDSNT